MTMLAPHDRATLSKITTRQHQILALMSTGEWNRKQIARLLGITPITVKNQVSDAYRRLGVDNLVAALRATGCVRGS